MQSLVFEQAWDKTIDPQDREKIEAIFSQANRLGEVSEKFLPLWQACNHRGDLLVAVIIQNFSERSLVLRHVSLTYYEADQPVATHAFSDPRLMIESKCSMPWTFIFPKSKIRGTPCFVDGYVKEHQ